MPGPSFEIVYDEAVYKHLASIELKHYSLIQGTIGKQLSHEPEVETRNRKPLNRPSALGTVWELRFGPDNRFRVFYRLEASANQVRVLAIGVKTGSRLNIGGEEFEL
jgi:hypothetical protein